MKKRRKCVKLQEFKEMFVNKRLMMTIGTEIAGLKAGQIALNTKIDAVLTAIAGIPAGGTGTVDLTSVLDAVAGVKADLVVPEA